VLRDASAGPWLRRPAYLAGGLVLLQLALGASVIWSRRAVLPTTTHLVVGAALLATCLVLALRAGRVAAPRAVPAEGLQVRRQALA
jgi:heme A synthase